MNKIIQLRASALQKVKWCNAMESDRGEAALDGVVSGYGKACLRR